MSSEMDTLRLLEWELTGPPETDALTSREIADVFQSVSAFAKPAVVLTGNGVLARSDLFEIAEAGARSGFEMILDPRTNDLPSDLVRTIAAHAIKSIVVRIDASSAPVHDEVHGVGDFDMAQATMEFCRQSGLAFSVATTITRKNLNDLPVILDLAIRVNAVGFHPTVPIPEKGEEPKNRLSAKEYEDTLGWIAERRELVPSWFDYAPTCTPQYYRIVRQQRTIRIARDAIHERYIHQIDRGCSGGRSSVFITAAGTVQTCSSLRIPAGSLRSSGYDFRKIWDESELFQTIRNPASLSGRCRICEYTNVCGGCRARAYALTGDYRGEEPYCDYDPGSDSEKKSESAAETAG